MITGSAHRPAEAFLLVGMLPGERSARDPGRAIKPGRHGMPRELVAELQRERLIDGFVRVVARDGYSATTIAKVTNEAGVTKKAFYSYFDTLDECFVAACERGAAIISLLVSEAARKAPNWPESVRTGLDVLLKVLASAEPFARVAVVEFGAANTDARRVRSRYFESLRAIFKDQQVSEHIIDAVIGGIFNAIYLQVDAGRVADLPELLPSLTYFTLLPFIGPEQASLYLNNGIPAAD
jgi:AcrR family transcriptional regulator